MELAALLRKLIGQLQDLFDFRGSPFHLYHRTSLELHHICNCDNRWCTLDTNDETKAMSKEIWKEFPEDLFEAVLARVPIATFFHLQTVCRRWNSLLYSDSFSQHFAEIPQAHPWIYTITDYKANYGAMYDPSLKKWYHRTVPSQCAENNVLPVASAGGLLCFIDLGHASLYVCNPLTQSFRKLPPRVWNKHTMAAVRNERSMAAVGMTINRNEMNGAYKILFVYRDGEYEVYDSVKNSWSRPGAMPSLIKSGLSLSLWRDAVFVDDTVYFMFSHIQGVQSYPEGIASYNMLTGVWKQIPGPGQRLINALTMAECEGRIMLVGWPAVAENEAKCLCIWELQKPTFRWKEVDRVPDILSSEFNGGHFSTVCLGKNGVLLLALWFTGTYELVSYNMKSKEWVKVCSCCLPLKKEKFTWGVEGMTINKNETNGAYKILLAYRNGELEVYDSVENSWSQLGAMPSHIKSGLLLTQRRDAVSVDDTVYFPFSNIQGVESYPEWIASYNMLTGVWKQIPGPGQGLIYVVTMAECEGRIMLVGYPPVAENEARPLCIWELQKPTFWWKKVDGMPNILCSEFNGKQFYTAFLGKNGVLFLSLWSTETYRLVSYDVKSKEWVKVCSCCLPLKKRMLLDLKPN